MCILLIQLINPQYYGHHSHITKKIILLILLLFIFQDPEVAEAFKEISTNPTNILKYQSNPKIMAFINKMASKFGGAGGFPGMMGGMPGFPGAGTQTTPKPKPQDDVGLD